MTKVGKGDTKEQKDNDGTFVGIIVFTVILSIGSALAVYFINRNHLGFRAIS